MQQIRATVAHEFEQVNQLIVDQLHSNVDMVENVGHYIVDAGGKRLRPLLVLLSGAALGRCSDSHITFAAIIEFIHTATLLHDDVVDISTLRRGDPPPMPSSAMRPRYWWATSSIHARSS